MRYRLVLSCSFFALAAILVLLMIDDPQSRRWKTWVWRCPEGRVELLEYAPSDRRFAVLIARPGDGFRRQLLVIDAKTGTTLLDVDGMFGRSVCFSPDSNRIAVLWAKRLKVYSIPSGDVLLDVAPEIDKAFPYSLAFTEDGSTVVLARHDISRPRKDEAAWNLRSGKPTKDFSEPTRRSGRGISPDGSMFFTGGWPGPTPRVYSLKDGHRISYCFRYPWSVFASFTPDSRNLLTLHKDGAMVLWKLSDTENENSVSLKSEFDTGLETSRALALLNRTRHIAYIDSDGKLRVKRLFARSR